MKKSSEKIIIFSIGAIGYGLIEILWRGHTHWSMLGLGGICFSFFSFVGKIFERSSIVVKALIGCLFVTLMEFITGFIFNIVLKKNIWDYSKIPLNIGGQVCALYSFFWLILSAVFIPVACFVTKKLKNS